MYVAVSMSKGTHAKGDATDKTADLYATTNLWEARGAIDFPMPMRSPCLRGVAATPHHLGAFFHDTSAPKRWRTTLEAMVQ